MERANEICSFFTTLPCSNLPLLAVFSMDIILHVQMLTNLCFLHNSFIIPRCV